MSNLRKRLDRDKAFFIIRKAYSDDVRVSDEQFEKILNGISLLNPRYYDLLKEYNIKNKNGFLCSRAPFAHRHAGGRLGNMRNEKAKKRMSKQRERHEVSKYINQQLAAYY
jgi:hypothetical protein